jgi:glycosyltransferase involved in cell wall biosynthesis
MTAPLPSRRLRLCFVNLDAFPALVKGHEMLRIGGEEVQHALLSTLFADEGHDVDLVTGDFGQVDGMVTRGVRVLKSFRADAGVPVLRFVHPRWTLLHAALKRSNADVYYVSCAGALVGWVAWFAAWHGRRVVFRVASDTDCDPARLLVRRARDRWLYHYGLNRADAVLAQTEHQVELLRQHHGIDATIAPMALDLPATGQPKLARDIDVLWVANLRALKRPELFVQVAQKLPDLRFHLVGGAMRDEPDVAARLQQLAASVPNLQLRGRLGYQDTLALVARARLFASTSLTEGFPNTFLQAWARGVPTVSFFDPDGLATRHGLGVRVASVEQMAAQIQSLLADAARLAGMSDACVGYMQRHHDRASVLQPYLDALVRPVTEFAPT